MMLRRTKKLGSASTAHINPDASERMKQQDFIAVIVHQLRTPLTVIKFVAEELAHAGGAHVTDNQRKKLAAIMEADERALNIVNNFLSSALLFGEDQKLEITACDLRRAFETIVDALRPMAAVKNQTLTFIAPHDIIPVRACNEYLNRAFQNILDNAISYGDENSTIVIILRKHNREYIVSVHNAGPEIPRAELPNMFKKFHRLPAAEKIKPAGSGLGLFIAKTTVELNGGRIWIESEKGNGTTVYFTVPIDTRVRKIVHNARL